MKIEIRTERLKLLPLCRNSLFCWPPMQKSWRVRLA